MCADQNFLKSEFKEKKNLHLKNDSIDGVMEFQSHPLLLCRKILAKRLNNRILSSRGFQFEVRNILRKYFKTKLKWINILFYDIEKESDTLKKKLGQTELQYKISIELFKKYFKIIAINSYLL